MVHPGCYLEGRKEKMCTDQNQTKVTHFHTTFVFRIVMFFTVKDRGSVVIYLRL